MAGRFADCFALAKAAATLIVSCQGEMDIRNTENLYTEEYTDVVLSVS